MSRLILHLDDAVVKRAKRYAHAQGLSLSQLVERYLDSVSMEADCPVLGSISGILKRANPRDYKRHLVRKYG